MQQLTALVDQLKLNVKTAAKHGNTFDRVERSNLTGVLKIGDQAVELLLALQGDSDLGEQIQNSDGKASLRS